MEFCCPNPEHPVISTTPQTLKHRRMLRYVLYGCCYVVLVKFFIWGTLSGILSLISVWIAYNAWATMHFCNTMVVLIFTALDLLMILIDFSRINAALAYSNSLLKFMFYGMIVYYVFAIVVSFRAYRCFKE